VLPELPSFVHAPRRGLVVGSAQMFVGSGEGWAVVDLDAGTVDAYDFPAPDDPAQGEAEPTPAESLPHHRQRHLAPDEIAAIICEANAIWRYEGPFARQERASREVERVNAAREREWRKCRKQPDCPLPIMEVAEIEFVADARGEMFSEATDVWQGLVMFDGKARKSIDGLGVLDGKAAVLRDHVFRLAITAVR
jgi:hypothetical protein